MNRIPQHKASSFFDFGVTLHHVTPENAHHSPVTYAHQDDYYIFGLLTHGTACGIIDFKKLQLKAGDAFIVQPGQVHRFVCSEQAEGWILMTDSKFVGETEKCCFDNFSLMASSFNFDEQQKEELVEIATLLERRFRLAQSNQSDIVVPRLTAAFIAIVAEAVQRISLQQSHLSLRHREIVLSFRALLAEHLCDHRQPSYYASQLNISTMYLNEVMKKLTGMSTASYIKSEVVLQAKRMLVNTALPIRQIAYKLGFDDEAYFTRLFSQCTGTSPTLFRSKNLD